MTIAQSIQIAIDEFLRHNTEESKVIYLGLKQMLALRKWMNRQVSIRDVSIPIGVMKFYGLDVRAVNKKSHLRISSDV